MKLKHEFNPEIRKARNIQTKEEKIIKLLNKKKEYVNSKYFHMCSKEKQKQIKAEENCVPLWAWQ